MINGIKSSKDGTLKTTLGKKLIKSLKLKAADLKAEPILLSGHVKEVTFANVPDTISLYIDTIDEDHRLTIEDKCSIEALISASFIQVKETVNDNDIFEIWLWD